MTAIASALIPLRRDNNAPRPHLSGRSRQRTLICIGLSKRWPRPRTGKPLGGLMIITIAQVKGGVGKTTTAIHVAGFMQTRAPTILADGDIVRASSKWAQRGTGKGLAFKVVPIGQLARHVRDYEHVVIDTEANPSDKDFKDAAQDCDLLIIPAEPETTATDGLSYPPSSAPGTTDRVLPFKAPRDGINSWRSLRGSGPSGLALYE
jgi:hypothetical protein